MRKLKLKTRTTTPKALDTVDESEVLLRKIDIFLNVKNKTKPKNIHFEEFELQE